MRPDELYELYRDQLASEGEFVDPWQELPASHMIAWGKLCRWLQNNHHLDRL
jgi:hypothetical protein